MNSDPPSEPDHAAAIDELNRSALDAERVGDDDHSRVSDSLIDQARGLFEAALETFQSSLALLKAELRLARTSALMLLLMSAALIVLCVGAWLSVLALIAAGVHQFTGNWFVGIGTVALLNAIGIFWAYSVIKRCLHDMGMPRTRRMLSGMQSPAPESVERAQ